MRQRRANTWSNISNGRKNARFGISWVKPGSRHGHAPYSRHRMMDMKITAIETIQDPNRPLIVWVLLHTDSGLKGLGETYQSPGAIVRMIHGTLAKILLGQEATQIELLWHHMFKTVHYAGYAGAEMRAISAIDIALWDLLGKATDLPVYALLGGACRDRIPTYNTCVGF